MGFFSESMIDAVDTLCGLDLDKNDGNMLVCKSIPLLSLTKTPMTLMELKLFDIYLGRINPQIEDMTKIVFQKKELEKLLNVDKINCSELTTALDNLVGRRVVIYDGKERITVSLLSTAKLKYEDKSHSKLMTITMDCSPEAKKYIYNIGSIGYIKMSLKRLVSFKSRYVYSMYQYLNANSYRFVWTENLIDLKPILGVQGKYKEYRDFNKRVLQLALEEIQANTDMRYTYEPILQGGRTVAIRFHVTHKDTTEQELSKAESEVMPAEQEQEQVKPDIDVEHDTTWLDGKITLGLYDESDEQLAF